METKQFTLDELDEVNQKSETVWPKIVDLIIAEFGRAPAFLLLILTGGIIRSIRTLLESDQVGARDEGNRLYMVVIKTLAKFGSERKLVGLIKIESEEDLDILKGEVGKKEVLN